MKLLLKLLTLSLIASPVYADSIKGMLEQIKERNQNDKAKNMVSERKDRPRDHYIDPYRVERISKEESYYDVCKNKEFKSFYERSDCTKSATEKYRSEYPDRGTEQYSAKVYANLSKADAKAKRSELLKLMDTVSYYPKEESKDTELTVDHIRKEIFYIERYVIKINPRKYETR